MQNSFKCYFDKILLNFIIFCYHLKKEYDELIESGNTIYQLYVTNDNHKTKHKYGFLSSERTKCNTYKDMLNNLLYYYRLKKKE